MRNKGLIFGAATLIIGITVLAATFLTIGTERIVSQFKNTSIIYLIAFIFLALLASALATIRWRMILRAIGYKTPFFDLFQYIIIAFSISYITPLGRIGGAPVRMVLAKRNKIPYEKGLASVLLDSILENTLDILLAIFLLTALLIALPVHIPQTLRMTVIFGMFILLLAIAIFYYRMIKRKSVFFSVISITHLTKLKIFSWNNKKLHELDKTFSWFLRKKPKELLVIGAISALTWAILILQYNIALHAIGYNATIFQILMIIGVLAVTSMLPVPAGVGVLEFGQAGIFILLGLDPSIGIAFALLIRLRDFFMTLLGSGFLLHIGLNSIIGGNYIEKKK